VACGSTWIPPNTPPRVLVDSVTCEGLLCDLALRVQDAELDPVDLDLECALEDGTACTFEDAPGTDGRTGLIPDVADPGRAHLLRLEFSGIQPTTAIHLSITPVDARDLAGAPLSVPAFTPAEGLPPAE
jgi:hypothetical protein